MLLLLDILGLQRISFFQCSRKLIANMKYTLQIVCYLLYGTGSEKPVDLDRDRWGAVVCSLGWACARTGFHILTYILVSHAARSMHISLGSKPL